MLLFFLIQDNSDIKIECYIEDKLRNEKICNVSTPFMRAKSQVRNHTVESQRYFTRENALTSLKYDCGVNQLINREKHLD